MVVVKIGRKEGNKQDVHMFSTRWVRCFRTPCASSSLLRLHFPLLRHSSAPITRPHSFPHQALRKTSCLKL